MPAPKKNQFWKLRSKHGRDKLFASPELLWEAACEYFEWCEANPIKDPRAFGSAKVQRPFNIYGLCKYLDCNTVYLNHFEASLKDKTDPLSEGFSKVVIDIREAIFQQKFEHAVVGVYNANVISRDLGLVDKKEQNIVIEQPLFPDVH